MPSKSFAQFEISKNKWILLFACSCMFALGLADNIRGPLFLDLINYFRLSNTQASLSFAITCGFGFIGNLSSNRLLKIISLPSLLIQSLLLMATGLFFMGFTEKFYFYLVGSGVFGLSMGFMGVAQNLIVAENMEGPLQTKALSGLHGLYGFSSLAAPFVASYAPRWLGPWRSGFFVTAAVCVLIFAFSYFVRPAERIVHHADDELKRTPVSYPSLFILGGVLAFYGVAEVLISSRLALYMRYYFSQDLQESSLFVTYFFSFLLVGRLIFTFKSFAASLRKQLNLLLILSLICLLFGLITSPFFLALTGLAMGGYYPLAIAYLSEQTRRHRRRYITFALGFQNICLITMHLGVGYVTDQFGLLYAFGVGVISLLLTLLCVNYRPDQI